MTPRRPDDGRLRERCLTDFHDTYTNELLDEIGQARELVAAAGQDPSVASVAQLLGGLEHLRAALARAGQHEHRGEDGPVAG